MKCFGCESKPMGPLDSVMDVLGFRLVADGAAWIAAHFEIPLIAKRKRLIEEARPAWSVGLEGPLGVLIRSSLWTRLSEATRSIAPVLVELGQKDVTDGSRIVNISYRGISRYSGVSSPNAINRAIKELTEIGWLKCVSKKNLSAELRRPTGKYVITQYSDQLTENANFSYTQQRDEIAAERELRSRRSSQSRALESELRKS